MVSNSSWFSTRQGHNHGQDCCTNSAHTDVVNLTILGNCQKQTKMPDKDTPCLRMKSQCILYQKQVQPFGQQDLPTKVNVSDPLSRLFWSFPSKILQDPQRSQSFHHVSSLTICDNFAGHISCIFCRLLVSVSCPHCRFFRGDWLVLRCVTNGNQKPEVGSILVTFPILSK